MKNSAINEALLLAHDVNLPNVSENTTLIKLASDKIEKAKKLLTDLSGVEHSTKLKIGEIVYEETEKIRSLQEELSKQELLKMFGRQFKRLSLEPLTWRENNGTPRLVMFSINEYTFELSASSSKKYNTKPKLPKKIVEQFTDIFELLVEKKIKRKPMALTCQFDGMIPTDTKAIIREAEKTFGQEIYLISEPKIFSFNETNSVPLGKTLVVGYKQKVDENCLWLITDFHPITIESALTFEGLNQERTSNKWFDTAKR